MKLRTLVLAGVLAVSGVFSLGITGGHFGLDDWGYTSGCPFVIGGLTLANVQRAFCDLGYGAIWMPATFISYMLDVSLFGDSWHAYHAVNVLFHLMNMLVVYMFLKDQTSLFSGESRRAAAICAGCALLWALHPMRAEAVTFVAARKEELWTLFSLLGLLQYSLFLKGGGGVRYIGVILLFLLAAMSKPTAVCFPFLALAVHFAVWRKGTTRKSFAWLAPMVLMSVALGCLTVYSQSHPTNAVQVDVYDAKTWWRILNAAVSTGLYFWYTVVPFGVHMDYMAVFNGWPADAWLGLACLFAAFAAFLVLMARRSSGLRSAAVHSAMIFLFSIGPTLGVFGYVNGDQAMADRYVYFPHIAIALMLATCLIRFADGSSIRFRRCIAALLLAATAEAAISVSVVRSFENGYTACLRTLQKDPDNWRALRIVGNEYCARMNRMDDGIAMLRKSLKMRGSQITADSLAYALSIRGKSGDFAEVRRLGAAIADNPSLDEGGMMLDALGIASMREGEYGKAARYFAKGLAVRKRNHSTDFSQLYLGLNLANVGEDSAALDVLSRLQTSKNGYARRRAAEAAHVIRSGRKRAPFRWE